MTSPEIQTETVPRLRSILAAASMAASLALGGSIVNEAEAVTAAPTADVHEAGTAVASDSSECAPVSSESLHVTRKLLNHPHNFDATIKHIPHSHTRESEMTAKRQVAANKYGLTVYNYRSKYHALFSDASHHNEIPVSTYMQKTNAFFSHYGVDVTTPNITSAEGYADQMTPIDMNNLSISEQNLARRALTIIISDMGQLPVEFVKSVGLKHVDLVKINSPKVTGLSNELTGDTVYIDPTKLVDGQILSHEFTHLWDGKVCGGPQGSFLDQKFDALNPTTIYDQYPYGPSRITNRSVYTDRNTVASSSQAVRLGRKINRDYAHNNYAKAKRDFRQYDALFKNVVTAQPYGFTNVAEDKAIIGQEMLNPYDYQSIYDKDQPILSNKFALLMARIYQAHPRFAKYLIQVGNNTF